MLRRCPDCDQRLLPDEQVCWQCGARVEQAHGDENESAASPPSPSRSDGRPLRVYGALTAVTVLVALLLTSFLGTQPRNRLPLGAVPQGWTLVTDRQRLFAALVPQEWTVLTSEDQLAARVAPQDRYHSALAPLGGAVEDEEIVLLAESTQSSVFMVVARSQRLGRLSPADAVSLLGSSEGVLEARQLDRQGAAQAAFLIDIQQPERVWCHQRFIPVERWALLLSLCFPPERLDADTITTLLSSVQPLQ